MSLLGFQSGYKIARCGSIAQNIVLLYTEFSRKVLPSPNVEIYRYKAFSVTSLLCLDKRHFVVFQKSMFFYFSIISKIFLFYTKCSVIMIFGIWIFVGANLALGLKEKEKKIVEWCQYRTSENLTLYNSPGH